MRKSVSLSGLLTLLACAGFVVAVAALGLGAAADRPGPAPAAVPVRVATSSPTVTRTPTAVPTATPTARPSATAEPTATMQPTATDKPTSAPVVAAPVRAVVVPVQPAAGRSPAFTCTGGCAMPPDASCAIKGNVNSKGEKIYHSPGQQAYNRTDIKPEEGDRWFCSAAEAVAAGFRAAQR